MLLLLYANYSPGASLWWDGHVPDWEKTWRIQDLEQIADSYAGGRACSSIMLNQPNCAISQHCQVGTCSCLVLSWWSVCLCQVQWLDEKQIRMRIICRYLISVSCYLHDLSFFSVYSKQNGYSNTGRATFGLPVGFSKRKKIYCTFHQTSPLTCSILLKEHGGMPLLNLVSACSRL